MPRNENWLGRLVVSGRLRRVGRGSQVIEEWQLEGVVVLGGATAGVVDQDGKICRLRGMGWELGGGEDGGAECMYMEVWVYVCRWYVGNPGGAAGMRLQQSAAL